MYQFENQRRQRYAGEVSPACAGLAQVVQLHGKLRPVRITSGLVLVDYSGFDAIFVNTSACVGTNPTG
jgi:hypothetical protein